jgi:hypothetical protein
VLVESVGSLVAVPGEDGSVSVGSPLDSVDCASLSLVGGVVAEALPVAVSVAVPLTSPVGLSLSLASVGEVGMVGMVIVGALFEAAVADSRASSSPQAVTSSGRHRAAGRVRRVVGIEAPKESTIGHLRRSHAGAGRTRRRRP